MDKASLKPRNQELLPALENYLDQRQPPSLERGPSEPPSNIAEEPLFMIKL